MKVYLLGAGPGDPGLLTVKAKRVLETADVIVYDYLANKTFLSYRRDDAEVIYVGKKGGDHTLPQADINKLLVAKAKEGAGKVVARLKGGDPYVFGRGAEEAQELLEAGVAVEVVPGVTSAVAGPAYAGIPVTHRKYASSASFITGHEDPTKAESALNWEALANSASTLVFFMGMKNVKDISANLMAQGMPGDKPCALVRWGTTCRHRSHVTTLDKLADDAVRLKFSAPSLIVVGDVCQLRDELNFFERKPLLGKGVVVTRAREQASETTALLEELGACVFEFPTIAISPLDDEEPLEKAIIALPDYDWLVFTSVNGVRVFCDKLYELGLDARAFAGLEVAAIGPATAAKLREYGIKADLTPAKYVAESVVEAMLGQGLSGKKVLIPRAKEAREVLPEELVKAGAYVTILPVYETTPSTEGREAVVEALAAGEIDYVTFASSSTVDNFFAVIDPELVKAAQPGVKLAVIGPVTGQTLEKHGFQSDLSPEDYTIPALISVLVDDAAKGKA